MALGSAQWRTILAISKKQLRKFLEELPREQLANWLLTVARDVPDFGQRLQFYAATHESWEAAVKASFEAIDRFSALERAPRKPKVTDLIRQGRFLLESLRACLDFHPEKGLEDLVEQAMVAFDRMANEDAKVAELQREFASLHLRAMEIIRPEPKALAARLFQLRSEGNFAILPDAPRSYADLLGPEGLAHYRSLLEPVYRVVVLGDKPTHRTQREAKQYLNRRIMLFEWATVSPDEDERIAILLAMSRQPDDVLTVANYLDARQRPMDAIEIVRQAHRKAPAPKLAEYLAERFEQQNQWEDAAAYRWSLLEREPTRTRLDELLRASTQTPNGQRWRERAMELVGEKAKGLFVDLLIDDDRLEDALSVARQNGARLEAWARLADRYATRDPRTAIELYFDCAQYALKGRLPSPYLAQAWGLAVDNITFQVFTQQLRLFFERNKVSERYLEQLEAEGIPVAKLVGTLDSRKRKS